MTSRIGQDINLGYYCTLIKKFKMKNIHLLLLAFLLSSLMACQSDSATKTSVGTTPAKESKFKEALTFYASFDEGTTADFALGDKNMYTAPSFRQVDSSEVGNTNINHQILANKGQSGAAFQFGKKSKQVTFYKSKGNIAHNATDWTGTISFWLSLDPVTDLAPGFTDPIQITDVSYNDASIWVDFTKENPRDFRLGVFGDKATWTKDTLNSPVDTVMEKRFVRVTELPFAKNKWTHILISYQGLGTANSTSSLYIDGQKIGSIDGITDPFTWELEKSNIYLGLSFVGLMDELAIFNTAFTAEEAMEFHQLKDGMKAVL